MNEVLEKCSKNACRVKISHFNLRLKLLNIFYVTDKLQYSSLKCQTDQLHFLSSYQFHVIHIRIINIQHMKSHVFMNLFITKKQHK